MTNDILKLIEVLPDNTEYIPDKDVFRATLFNINPSGNFEEAYRILVLRLSDIKNTHVPEGEKVFTYKYLCTKYDEYLNYWQSVFGDKDPKYIAKTDKQRNPEAFLDDKFYNQIFSVTKGAKDFYIFGANSFETLRRKLAIFKQRNLNQNIEIPKEVKPPKIKINEATKSSEPF